MMSKYGIVLGASKMLSEDAEHPLLQTQTVQLCVSVSMAANLPHLSNLESQMRLSHGRPSVTRTRVAPTDWLLGGSANLPRAVVLVAKSFGLARSDGTVKNNNNEVLSLSFSSRRQYPSALQQAVTSTVWCKSASVVETMLISLVRVHQIDKSWPDVLFLAGDPPLHRFSSCKRGPLTQPPPTSTSFACIY